MEVIHSEKRLCMCCMEEHDVKTVRIMEDRTFKNTSVEYEAVYFYCDRTEELYMDETMISENDIAMKDAYRKEEGLLTSEQIYAIRKKYGISQQDLCLLLGWGAKTITRYESHQVQDKAHDTILKKLNNDPEWFLYLLLEVKDTLSVTAYNRYWKIATTLYESTQDSYLRKAIKAQYAKYHGNQLLHGNSVLSLDKVVDVIRYFAGSAKVTDLYMVKLMKLLWYGDALSYKKRGHAITGLVYQAMPMGAAPIACDLIIELNGVPCEEIDMGETYVYYFKLNGDSEYLSLNQGDRDILDIVIEKFGKMRKDEIITIMHREQAYSRTKSKDMISFKYTEHLQI